MKHIKKTLEEISNNFKILSDHNCEEIEQASKLMIQSLSKGGKIIFCGNGGSAADSQHLSAELIGRYRKNRKPLPSISLTTDTSVITCIANDFGYEKIFERQLQGLGQKGDLLIAFSTSGNSKNIVNVLKMAKNLKIKSISLLGNKGGLCKNISNYSYIVPSNSTANIQEVHHLIGHMFCSLVD